MPGSVKREHQTERLQAVRLRYSINTHLEDQGIRTPAVIGAATGLPADEAYGCSPAGSGATATSPPCRRSLAGSVARCRSTPSVTLLEATQQADGAAEPEQSHRSRSGAVGNASYTQAELLEPVQPFTVRVAEGEHALPSVGPQRQPETGAFAVVRVRFVAQPREG